MGKGLTEVIFWAGYEEYTGDGLCFKFSDPDNSFYLNFVCVPKESCY